MDMSLILGRMKMFSDEIVVMVTQFCEYTKNSLN